MAQEWIFRGIEQKVFSYGFLLLGLSSVFRARGFHAGLFCGSAIAFHILVGGWGAMALACAVLLSLPQVGRRTFTTFFSTASVIGIPFLALAVWAQLPSGSPDLVVPAGFDPIEFFVLFRVPHHVDPAVFLTGKNFLKLVVLGAAVFFAAGAFRHPGRARILGVFLAVAVGIFLVGLLARAANVFPILYVYPFRIANVLVPLFFWLIGIEFLSRTSAHVFRTSSLGTLLSVRTLALATLFLVAGAEMVRDVAPNFRQETRGMVNDWAGFLSGEQSPYDEMTRWIRENTPPTAISAAPPCHGDFLIKAERRMVASAKDAPSGKAAYGWLKTLEALNGAEPYSSVGFEICPGLDESFNNLDEEDLTGIRGAHHADFFLTMVERTDLRFQPVHRVGGYYLYDLTVFGKPSLTLE
jgi:hypothetical protein